MPPLPDSLEEAGRIAAAVAGISEAPVRLAGSAGIHLHCPGQAELAAALERRPADIDLVTRAPAARAVAEALAAMGYTEDPQVTRMFGDRRLLFHDELHRRHVDLFLDELRFCHVVPLRGRLEADSPTLPLAELLLQKLQIVRLTGKDVLDCYLLLLEHPVGEGDRETVAAGVIARLCAEDWGLWRTLTGNLDQLAELLPGFPTLGPGPAATIRSRLAQLRAAVDREPKSLRWKVRARIGERVRWYEEVEELMDR